MVMTADAAPADGAHARGWNLVDLAVVTENGAGVWIRARQRRVALIVDGPEEAPPEEEPVVDFLFGDPEVPGVSEVPGVAAVVPEVYEVPGVSEAAGVAAVAPKVSKVPGVSEVAAEVPEVSEVHSGGPQHFKIHSQDDAEEAIQVPDKVTTVSMSSAVSKGRYHKGASPTGDPEILAPQLHEVGRIFVRWFRVYPLADPPVPPRSLTVCADPPPRLARFFPRPSPAPHVSPPLTRLPCLAPFAQISPSQGGLKLVGVEWKQRTPGNRST
jgi:hypothetical protein